MDRVGDDQAGFSVGYDPVGGVVTVTAWGFWSADIAAAFAPKVATGIRERSGEHTLVLDMRELKPMREEGQKAFATLVRALPTLGVTHLSVVTSSQLTKLQLVRLVTETATSVSVDWVTNLNRLARNA
jgi:hypothetical protein